MTFAGLTSWWNLIFALPFGVAVIYLFIYTLTGVTFGESDLAGDVGGDAHLDAEAHADAAGDHDAAEHGSESQAIHPVFAVLSLVGVGRVPLSLLLTIFLILWGIVGMALNQLLSPHLQLAWMIAAINIPITGVIACALTGIIARFIGRFMPMTETYSRSKASLVGRPAQAVSVINETFGLAAVRETSGDMYQVPCRVAHGKPAIEKGAAIVLYDYDGETQVFSAALLDRKSTPRELTQRHPPSDPPDRRDGIVKDTSAAEPFEAPRERAI